MTLRACIAELPRGIAVIRLLAAVSLLTLPAVTVAENWPQWRGPTNNGVSNEKGIPSAWGEGQHIAWKLPMPGIGGSTPAIWGDRIFLTSADGKDLVLLCATTDGKVLWKKKAANVNRTAFMRDEGNEAGASPSTDGKHVWVFFATGDVACFDFDGNEIWSKNVQKDYGRFSIQHGMHVTPLLHEDKLYVVLLTNGGHWIAALDKMTGKEIWKHERKSDAKGESREAYSSPILWTTGKEPCIVVLGCDYTTAHSLKDGSEIWRITELNPKKGYSAALRIIASPVAAPDELIVPTARGGLVVAVKPGATGTIDPGNSFELWRNPKGAPDVPSPLIHDGIVYFMRENGNLQAVDAATGKELYNKRLHADRYRASPVLVDGKVITTSRDGTFHVVKAGREFEELGKNSLPDTFTASPAISGGRMYLRGFQNLYAIDAKAK
jgi:outer membrane protein assembly factor BamB